MFASDQLEWMPVDPANATDGWVAYWPTRPWQPGDVVTMSAGATTVSGFVIGPVTFQFVIVAPESAVAPTVWQPSYSNFDSSGLDLSAESNDITLTAADAGSLPAHSEGVGEPYAIGPEEAYAKPQRVWLPAPAGIDPSQLHVYYYHANGDRIGWYPAENVDGFLVPDSLVQVDANGAAYVGFLIRHAGIVQLGRPVAAASASAASAAASVAPAVSTLRGAAGDVLLIMLSAAVLTAAQREYARRRAR